MSACRLDQSLSLGLGEAEFPDDPVFRTQVKYAHNTVGPASPLMFLEAQFSTGRNRREYQSSI